MKEKMKKRDVFYGIIAIATLIVAIIGATLAYFTITVTSAENAVGAKAAVVSINYIDGQQVSAQADKLIPAVFDTVVKPAFEEIFIDNSPEPNLEENICIDDNDNQVCSVYKFSVSSSNDDLNITATLNNEINEFTFLSYAVYDATNGTWLKVNGDAETKGLNRCVNEEEEATNCYAVNDGVKTYNNPTAGSANSAVNSLFGLTTGTKTEFTQKTVNATEQLYYIVLFIEENNGNQNIDQGATYSGTLFIDVVPEDGEQPGIITGEWK